MPRLRTAKEITVSPRCVRQTVPRLRAAKEITNRLCLDWELPKKSLCHQDVWDRLRAAKEINVSPRFVWQTVPRSTAVKTSNVSRRSVRQTVPRLRTAKEINVSPRCAWQTVISQSACTDYTPHVWSVITRFIQQFRIISFFVISHSVKGSGSL